MKELRINRPTGSGKKKGGMLLILFAFFLTATAFTQKRDSLGQPAVNAFSIQQCIDYAKKNNGQIKNAILDLKIQVQDNKATTAGALPTLSASANFTDYFDIPTTLLPGIFLNPPQQGFFPVQFGTKYNASGAVTLQQTLFDGQVFVGLQARKASIDYRLKGIDITEETIRANIYKVYYQLVVSKTQVEQLDANIEKLQALAHVNSEMFKNGFAERIDIDRTNVQLANLQTERDKVISSVNNGYLGLKLLIGMPIRDSLILTDQVTEDKIKEGLLNEADYKYTDRNDYQLLMLGKTLGEYNIKRYKLSHIPVLNFTGVYNKNAQRSIFDFGSGNWFTTSYIGFNLNIPIFEGFKKTANEEKARLQLQQTQNQLENLQLSIDNDVKQAANNFHQAIRTLDYQKQNMQLADQVYGQSKKKYEAGTGSTIDITNAQSDLRVAQSNYISAMYDAIIAKIDYLKAIGKLP